MVNEVEPEDINEDSILSFVQKLPRILFKPSRLESLEVFINFWLGNEAAERHRGHRFPPMELVLNLANLAKVTQALAEGLGASSLEHLKDLSFHYHSHDFVELSRALPDTLLSRLQYLHLEVTDVTGPDGAESYVGQADGSNDRDEESPLFSLQQLYPNIRYVFGIFDIVSCCSNPKS